MPLALSDFMPLASATSSASADGEDLMQLGCRLERPMSTRATIASS